MRGHRSQAHADPTGSASRQHNPGLPPLQLSGHARASACNLTPAERIAAQSDIGLPAEYKTPLEK